MQVPRPAARYEVLVVAGVGTFMCGEESEFRHAQPPDMAAAWNACALHESRPGGRTPSPTLPGRAYLA